MVLLSYYCFISIDEKERFDPSQFQESIVQGLNQTGTDLDAVAKFLDASGAKLDYRRYAETLFDILVAGGMLGNEPRILSLFSLLRVRVRTRLTPYPRAASPPPMCLL